MIFAHLLLMALWCSEPLMGLTVLRPSASVVCSFAQLEPLLSGGVVSGPLARLPPIAALRSPLKDGPTSAGEHPCAGAEASEAMGKRLFVGEPNTATGRERV